MSSKTMAKMLSLTRMLTATLVALIIISTIVIGAWWSGNLGYASLGAEYVPMTLSVAVAMLLLSAALFIGRIRPTGMLVSRAPLAIALLVLVVSCWVLADFRLNTGLDLDKLLGAGTGTASGYVLAEASPISAATVVAASTCCFLIFCGCFQRRSNEPVAPALALFVFSVGMIVTLGYLYGSPVLYGGEVRPVSLLAGISYALLGFALTLSQGQDKWPLRVFVGASVKARLMRSFLPVIIVVVIVSGSLANRALLTSGNPALTASLIALVTAIVVGYIITRLSASMGGEIDRANADLLKARERLRIANEKLTVLGSITRHDALNRLAVVLGRLELMKERTEDPAMTRQIDESLSAARAVQSIIQFTGEYQGIGTEEPQWVDVEEAFREAVRDVDHDVVSTGFNAPKLEVLADDMFGKVLANLVDNSLRHGGQVRRIRLDLETNAGGLVLVYTDDGVGLAHEDKEKLFRRGFGKHTGLGMYLSREILQFTGLGITETGTPGKGARFEMTIPDGKYRFKDDGSDTPW